MLLTTSEKFKIAHEIFRIIEEDLNQRSGYYSEAASHIPLNEPVFYETAMKKMNQYAEFYQILEDAKRKIMKEIVQPHLTDDETKL